MAEDVAAPENPAENGQGAVVAGAVTGNGARLVGAEPSDGGGGGGQPAGDGIGGMSALRGLLVYAAVLAFAGLYIDFIVVISNSRSGVTPAIDGTMISAAAALSGVLGSAFALKIGVTPTSAQINQGLARHATQAKHKGLASKFAVTVRRALSLEPERPDANSWPLTLGIWAYGAIATAVAVAYVLNQNETPGAVKALAVTFAGYVLALIHMAYGLTKPDA